jgi:hypothetical protein
VHGLDVTCFGSGDDDGGELHINLITTQSLKSIIQAPGKREVTHVTEGRSDVGVDLPPDLLPPAAEGVILGQIPLITRVDHAIEARVVVIEVSVLVVVLTPQLREGVLQFFEHLPLDHHETCGPIQNFDETVDDLPGLRAEIYDEGGGEHGHRSVVALLDRFFRLVPHDDFLRITRATDVVRGLHETHDCFRVEVDVRVDEEEKVGVGLLHESTDGDVSRAMDQGFVFCSVDVELNILTHQQQLQLDD